MAMSLLTHPDIRALELGSAGWFGAQRELIRAKPLVKGCYDLWYRCLREDVESVPGEGIAVELGSGAGYLREFLPEVVTSDVVPGVADMVIDGTDMPFEDETVRAILLTHVFHHMADVRQFLREAERVLVPGGVISMVDCAHTALSRLFFGRLHPEPYDHSAEQWCFDTGSHMLDSNQALSWIVFFRDRERFEEEFPEFRIERVGYLPWLGYLLSGGANLRNLVPRSASSIFSRVDVASRALDRYCAIHWHITVRRLQRGEQCRSQGRADAGGGMAVRSVL